MESLKPFPLLAPNNSREGRWEIKLEIRQTINGALAPKLLNINSVEMALIGRPRARGRRADAFSAISN